MTHLELVKKALPEGGALLITSNINQRWISGFDYTDGYVFVTKKSAALITDFRYIEAAKAQADHGFEVVMPNGMLAEIDAIATNDGVKTIYVEEATLSLSDFERIKDKIKAAEFASGASAILDGFREFKDAPEIEKMKKAQAVTDAAFSHILGYITPDKTEIDVALELEFFMRSHGAEGTAFQTIAVSGKASSMPHGVPRNVKLEKGFFTMDFGAKVDGYCSDMTRTIVLGKADTDMKKLYNTVYEAQMSAIEAMINGERGQRKLDAIARDIIDNAGYKGCFGHSLGHGVGLYIHEEPRLSPKVDEKYMLKPGHVVTVEPGIYIEGLYGCRIEDMVAVLDNGIYDFTKSDKKLIEL